MFVLKAAKYDTKNFNLSRNIVSFIVDVSRCFQRKVFPEKRPPYLFTFGYTRARSEHLNLY